MTCAGFDRTSYAAGETGFVEFRATDDVSGIGEFQGSCWSATTLSEASDIILCGHVEPLGGDLYRLEFEVGEFVENGTFYLNYIYLGDEAGNAALYYAEPGEPFYEDTDVAVQTTTIGQAITDVDAPVVYGFEFDQSSYARGDVGYVEYVATDGLSGVSDWEGSCWSAESASGNSEIIMCGHTESLGGDRYRLAFDVGEFIETGEFFLGYAVVSDMAGNYVTVRADYTESVYPGTSIPVARTVIF